MEAIESLYMHNLNQPTLDKQYLGFDPQPPETPSFSSEPSLQNPHHNPPNDEGNDVDDEKVLQVIVEDLQSLVLKQAFSEEREKRGVHGGDGGDEFIKEESRDEDEEVVRMIVEEIQSLVLNEAFSEERANGDIREENGGDEVGNEYGGNHYEGGDHSWSGTGNVIDVENAKDGEVGSREWGYDYYEDGDYSWSENGIVVDVENEEGGEAGSKEWGFNHYEDGDRSWRENGIDVANENRSEAGSKEWGFNANGRRLNYPIRPDAVDCAYYMKTGTCQYGLNCKFNHPSRRRNQQWAMEKGKQKEESEERAGLIECKYYLTEGGCKYGNACKYSHSRIKDASSPVLDFNFLGLPIRPGEKDCPYYMRNGSCKYGSNCRFHHPDPSTATGNDPSFGYNNDGSTPVQSASYSPVSSWSSPRVSNETAPFVPMVYPASQGILPLGSQWNRFQAPVYPTSEKSLPTPPAFTMKDPTRTNIYSHPQPPWLIEEYPERPGQPDCSYFIKTGDCKYKSNCKFHHPKTQKSKTNPPSVLSDKGLPLRPGQAVCSFYSRYGICKYGPACKFDHPEHNDNAASSPGFAFYQPPFGNSATTDDLRMARKGNGSDSLVQQSV